MKANEILFRPSEIYNIMTNPRTKTTNRDKYDQLLKKIQKLEAELNKTEDKKDINAIIYNIDILEAEKKRLEPLKDLPLLSKTTENFLKHKIAELKFNRRKELDNKYIRKGIDCEEAGITLYSKLKKRVFKNNKERKTNKYFTGEIDLPIYNKSNEVEEIADIKNAFDLHTFVDNLDEVKDSNRYQGLAYMDLYPTAKRFRIANVLINNTTDNILDLLYRESFRWPNQETPTWREIEIVKNQLFTKTEFEEFIAMRSILPVDEKSEDQYNSFVEIPEEERLIEHVIDRNEAEINDIKIRIDQCRLWLKIKYNLD